MKKRKYIDKLLIAAIVLMAVSGFLIRPMGEAVFIIAIHKGSALIFCILCIAHIMQYRKRRAKKYVS